jgi:hypothetical protein
LSFINNDWVIIYLKVSDDFDNQSPELAVCLPSATMLKLFQNVPQADLEMLFPVNWVGMQLIKAYLYWCFSQTGVCREREFYGTGLSASRK